MGTSKFLFNLQLWNWKSKWVYTYFEVITTITKVIEVGVKRAFVFWSMLFRFGLCVSPKVVRLHTTDSDHRSRDDLWLNVTPFTSQGFGSLRRVVVSNLTSLDDRLGFYDYVYYYYCRSISSVGDGVSGKSPLAFLVPLETFAGKSPSLVRVESPVGGAHVSHSANGRSD